METTIILYGLCYRGVLKELGFMSQGLGSRVRGIEFKVSFPAKLMLRTLFCLHNLGFDLPLNPKP